MVITSPAFLIISFASVFLFYLLNVRYRILLLSILSAGFIGSLNIFLLAYILVYALVNYYLGFKINDSHQKVTFFRLGIFFNLSQLILLKYSTFAIDPLFNLIGISIELSKLSEILLPVGISYFTLQGIGYLINIKNGWEKPEKDFLYFFQYIIYFPKFLSGPVERSNHFLPQLRKNNKINDLYLVDGAKLVLIGYFKKVAIANQLSPYALSVYTFDQAGGYLSWVLFLIQPLYLYFDFSGYTDIAIGISKMFGIDLLPNFQRPFFAENVTTFWKRFHMSLSSWFNDYIFRPTSFKYRRWGIKASLYAVLITWTLFGIWHGAGWTFMLIGLLQAFAISYEFFTKKIRLKIFEGVPIIIARWFGRVMTYLFYCVSLVFFFSPEVKSAMTFIAGLSSFNGPSPFTDISIKPFQLIIYVPLVLFMEFLRNDHQDLYERFLTFWCGKNQKYIRWTVYSVMITIIYISGFKSVQFIYANF